MTIKAAADNIYQYTRSWPTLVAVSVGIEWKRRSSDRMKNEDIDIVQVRGPDRGSATRNEAGPVHILYGRGHASVPMKRDEGHATSSHDEIHGP